MTPKNQKKRPVKYAVVYARTFANETYPDTIEQQIFFSKCMAVLYGYTVLKSHIFFDENIDRYAKDSEKQGMTKMNDVLFGSKPKKGEIEAIFCVSLDRLMSNLTEYTRYDDNDMKIFLF